MQPTQHDHRRAFWRKRRLLYNVVLLLAAALAGAAFVAVLLAWELWPPPPDEFEHADFEPISIVFGAVAFPGALLVANVCYLLGPASEVVLRPRDPRAFRERVFILGVFFSIAVVWLVPLNAWWEFARVQLRW